jgi:3-oxoacyl-[acyl-carrier protein] reductase
MTEPAFRDRVVLVTGAARGIGLATAQAFLRAGARLALCARDAQRLKAAENELIALGPVWTQPADVRDPAAVHAFVDAALAHYGRIDVLVNNAGRAWSGAFALQPPASVDEIIDVNLKGLLYVTQAVLPAMLKQRQGVIVNVASGAGQTGFAGLAVYSASKFAVVGFTEALAAEVAEQGLRVHAICPGAVATDMLAEVTGSRVGMPSARVAQAILQLAGPRPPVESGACLDVG